MRRSGLSTDRPVDRGLALHGVLSGGLPQSPMAGVAELADARDLKSRDPKGRPGSMPGPGTKRSQLGPHPRRITTMTLKETVKELKALGSEKVRAQNAKS